MKPLLTPCKQEAHNMLALHPALVTWSPFATAFQVGMQTLQLSDIPYMNALPVGRLLLSCAMSGLCF
jgi:hypothetical protein